MPAVAGVVAPIEAAAATEAARSQFEDLGAAALSPCAAGVTVMAATGIGGATVRPRSARRRLVRLRRGPITAAAAATTPMATGFARTATDPF